MASKISFILCMAAVVMAASWLTGSASALVYDECPVSAKVDDSWWNPGACEGGVYGRGELYLKWADAPFTNDTVEVESYTLTVSGVSKGTYFSIYVWNGYSWTILSGGVLDFRGDYVYDLHMIPRPYTDGSLRIKIVNRCDETLHIDRLAMAVEYEGKARDVTFTVKDCETGRKLSGVEVEVGETAVNTGSSGEAVFMLPKGKSYVADFSLNGYFGYKKSVYVGDSDGQEYDICLRKEKSHEIDVRNLDVDGNYIEFEIANVGNMDESVQYTLYINDRTIFSGSTLLDAGDEDEITASYAFSPGKYRVKARAVASGYADSETVTHCVAGYTGKEMCSNGNLYTEVMRKGCSAYWEDTGRDCDEDDVTPPADDDGSRCGVEILSLNYLNNIPSNVHEELTVTLKNTGESQASVTLKAYVDGSYVSTTAVTVPEDGTATATLRFLMQKGTRKIRVDAYACGSLSDTAEGTVTVTNPRAEPGVPQGPDVEESEPQEGVDQIFIDTEPEALKTARFAAVSLKVTVYPPAEKYIVSVSGVDRDWLSYPQKVDTVKSRDFYVYVSPEEAGNYTLRIRVYLGEEMGDVWAEETVKLTVTKEAAASEDGDGITGGIIGDYEHSPLVALAVVGALIAAVLMLVFARLYMIDHNRQTAGAGFEYPAGGYGLDEMKAAALDGQQGHYGAGGPGYEPAY